ncbi:mersacidin/lichenicidin family type 2 lantibiotic [Archangium gephyra]|uniref:mersacidin/lichenicidin family type 2 lantibiotic n=1 Tax=Archangium gephyra TaxID=48 RepID=UPI0035D4DCC8
MKKETIIRAWRDPEFRESLTSEERAALPECPAGQSITDLDEGDLASAVGGVLAFDVDLTCICSEPLTTRTTFTKTHTITTIREQTVLQVNVVLGR